MKIGELAELTNLSPSRIRFYERIGLFNVASRKPNGYRSYPPEAAILLKLIDRAQKVGFSLDELRILLPSDLKDWDHRSLIKAIQIKIHDIEEMQKTLEDSRLQLQEVLDEIEIRPDDIDCASTALRVLTHFGLMGGNDQNKGEDEK